MINTVVLLILPTVPVRAFPTMAVSRPARIARPVAVFGSDARRNTPAVPLVVIKISIWMLVCLPIVRYFPLALKAARVPVRALIVGVYAVHAGAIAAIAAAVSSDIVPPVINNGGVAAVTPELVTPRALRAV